MSLYSTKAASATRKVCDLIGISYQTPLQLPFVQGCVLVSLCRADAVEKHHVLYQASPALLGKSLSRS